MIEAYLSEFLLYLIIYAPFAAIFIWIYYGIVLKRCFGAAHVFFASVLLIYLLGVLCFCGSVTATDVLIIPAELRGSVNFIPFKGAEADEFLLNLILFVPFGAIFPLLFKNADFKKTVLYAFLFSLSIEIGQMFKYRAVDITDLIANTAGAALGFFSALPILKRGGKFINSLQAFSGNARHNISYEPLVLIIFAYALRFFADPLAVKLFLFISGV